MVIRRFASFYCVLCTGRICITDSDLRVFAGNKGCYHSGALHFLAGRFILIKKPVRTARTGGRMGAGAARRAGNRRKPGARRNGAGF